MPNRIELPCHYDLWMRGARTGTVIMCDNAGTWIVRLDHLQVRRLVHVPPADQPYCSILH